MAGGLGSFILTIARSAGVQAPAVSLRPVIGGGGRLNRLAPAIPLPIPGPRLNGGHPVSFTAPTGAPRVIGPAGLGAGALIPMPPFGVRPPPILSQITPQRQTIGRGNASTTADTCAGSGVLAFRVVQGIVKDGGTGANISQAYTAAQTVGNANLLLIGWDDTGEVINTPTDTAGNIYTLVGSIATNGVSMSIYLCRSIVAASAGSNTVTAHATSGTPTFWELYILELSGTGNVDTSAFATSAGSGTGDSGNITTANAKEFLIGYNFNDNTATGPGSGYSLITGSITSFGAVAESQITTSAGSHNATTPISGTPKWAQAIVAFALQLRGVAYPTTTADTCVSTGTIRSIGAGSASTTSDTCVAIGAHYHVDAGAGACTTTADTCAAAGTIRDVSAGACTTTPDTCAAVGALRVVGAGSSSTTADTCAAIGLLRVVGAASATTTRDTCVAVGVVRDVSTGACTTTPDTCVAVGLVREAGVGAPTTTRDTCAAVGVVRVVGVGSCSTTRDTCAGVGSHAHADTGTGSCSTTPDTCVAAGAVRDAASGLCTTTPDTCAGVGLIEHATFGVGYCTTAPDTCAAIGALRSIGIGSASTAPDTCVGIADVAIRPGFATTSMKVLATGTIVVNDEAYATIGETAIAAATITDDNGENIMLPGDASQLTCTIKSDAGVLVDPTTVVCQIRLPDGTTVAPTIAHPQTGVYAVIYQWPVSGIFNVRFTATGSFPCVAEAQYTIWPLR